MRIKTIFNQGALACASLFIVLLSLSTVFSAQDVPKDFTLQINWGATHAERGRASVFIRADGQYAEVELSEGPRLSSDIPSPKKYMLSKEDITKVYQAVQAANFFKLKDDYENPEIMDGNSTIWWLAVNGKQKTISLANYNVKELTAVFNEINKILSAKDKNWNFAFGREF